MPCFAITADSPTVGRINAQKEDAMRQIGSSLRNLKLGLLNGKIGCSFECRSLLLGTLIKYMHDDGFLEDGVTTASEGRSLKATIQRVREMKSPSRDWHRYFPSRSAGFSSNLSGPNPSCQVSLGSLIEPGLNEALESISGLGLYDQ